MAVPGRCCLFVFCTLLAGCAGSFRDRDWLNEELRDRTGASADQAPVGGFPPDVTLEDGLDEREVTSIALWRNLFLRAEMTRIDAARATLDEARRPANPRGTRGREFESRRPDGNERKVEGLEGDL